MTLFVLLLLWCLGFTIPAFLHLNVNDSFTLKIVEYNYSLVCHQSAEKCFGFDGVNFLVCARCTGIYFGALIASFVFLIGLKINFKKLLPLIISSVLLLTDVLLVNAGVYPYSKEFALLTGFIFGANIYIYIIEILELFISSTLQKQLNEK